MDFYRPELLMFFVTTEKYYGYYEFSKICNLYENWLAVNLKNKIMNNPNNYCRHILDKIVFKQYPTLIEDRPKVLFNMKFQLYNQRLRK